jgi:hypothetical protein
MSERISAEITIGGKLPAALVPGLIQAINSQECRDEWGGGIVNLPDPEEHLDEATSQLMAFRSKDRNGSLWFCDEEAANGEFDEIEGFCEEHDIDFRRESGRASEYPPEVKEFRSGMERSDVYSTDDEGNPLVHGGYVKSLVEKAEAFLAAEGDSEESLADLRTATETVRHLLPVDVRDLEPFEIA